MIQIYQSQYKQAVIDFILTIQREEFNLAITLEDQVDLLKIETFYQQRKGNFWIALEEEKVIGTIALLPFDFKIAAIRKVFVERNYRNQGLGKKLLYTTLNWAKEKELEKLYLGTVPVFKTALQFYAKNGFKEIALEDLPEKFPRMKGDTKFYCYTI